MVKRRWTCEGTKSPQVHLMVKMKDIDGSDHIYVSIRVVLSVMVYGRRSGEEQVMTLIPSKCLVITVLGGYWGFLIILPRKVAQITCFPSC